MGGNDACSKCGDLIKAYHSLNYDSEYTSKSKPKIVITNS